MSDFSSTLSFIKSQFPGQNFIPLHEPRFVGNERTYVLDAIDSTFVSSVGAYVNRFEEMMTSITNTKYAVATVNGTAALHIALLVANVKQNEEVLTQALTFVATANAIAYVGAQPFFIDVDKESMGMSSQALKDFLGNHAEMQNGYAYNKKNGRKIAACVPMHTFGHPCEIDAIKDLCAAWNIALIEDAAESLGSYYKNEPTGSFGLMGVFSFNGNKTVTCGGGGAIVTNDERIATLAKHLTVQAKVPHAWDFNHDHIAYNYRMPNLNAAMACAQLEQLSKFIANKRELALLYKDFFNDKREIRFKAEPVNTNANYWLNTVELPDRETRDAFLAYTNSNGVMTRPAWVLMNKLPMFSKCDHDGLLESEYLAERIVNIPSSVRIAVLK